MSAIAPCPSWRELLPAYHDHALPPKAMRRVAAHLAECPACTTAVQQLERDRARFLATYAESTGGEALRTAVLEKIDMISPTPNMPSVPLARYRWLAAFASLATAAVILLVGIVLCNTDLFPQSQETTANTTTRAIPSAVTRSQPRDVVASSPSISYAHDGTRTLLPPAGSPNAMDTFTSKSVHEKGMVAPSEPAIVFEKQPSNSITANPTLSSGGELNYGVPGGVRMSYDVNYQLQVTHALDGARRAQRIIRSHGGYTVDFQYHAEHGKQPMATFTGKIPVKAAESVLAEIETLGTVRSLNIAGTDITDEIRWRRDELKHQQGTIADETKRELVDLGLQHTLVTFSASFLEPMPPAPMTLHHAAAMTKNVLKYALLCVITLAVILLGLALIAAPILALRAWRQRGRLPIDAPEEYASTK